MTCSPLQYVYTIGDDVRIDPNCVNIVGLHRQSTPLLVIIWSCGFDSWCNFTNIHFCKLMSSLGLLVCCKCWYYMWFPTNHAMPLLGVACHMCHTIHVLEHSDHRSRSHVCAQCCFICAVVGLVWYLIQFVNTMGTPFKNAFHHPIGSSDG